VRKAGDLKILQKKLQEEEKNRKLWTMSPGRDRWPISHAGRAQLEKAWTKKPETSRQKDNQFFPPNRVFKIRNIFFRRKFRILWDQLVSLVSYAKKSVRLPRRGGVHPPPAVSGWGHAAKKTPSMCVWWIWHFRKRGEEKHEIPRNKDFPKIRYKEFFGLKCSDPLFKKFQRFISKLHSWTRLKY
jgi:hypothetical protein